MSRSTGDYLRTTARTILILLCIGAVWVPLQFGTGLSLVAIVTLMGYTAEVLLKPVILIPAGVFALALAVFIGVPLGKLSYRWITRTTDHKRTQTSA